MKLIDEARHWWRMFSVQAMGAALAIQGAWEALPDDMKASIPHEWVTRTTATLLVLGLLGRLVRQDKVPKDKP